MAHQTTRVSGGGSGTDLRAGDASEVEGGVETVRETDSGLEARIADSIRAIDRSRWNDVVDRSSRSSVFHRHEWLEAIETGLGYEPKHVTVEKDGNLIGLYPNFVVEIEKTPFYRLSSLYPGFGGPLLATDVRESLSLLTDAVADLCSGRTIVHQIRALDTGYLRYNDALQSAGYRPYRRECRFELDLSGGYDEALESMSKSRRRGIRRGRETDHEIRAEEVTGANLKRFHDVYERVMERVGGDVYPLSFFEALRSMESRLLLLSLRIDGEYAGGMLELLDEEQSAIHGFFAAVPEEYFDRHASELLYDHVIRWGAERGYETYDLGSTGSDFEDGVYRFKEGFGGRPVPVLVWEHGCSPLWRLVRAGRSVYWPYYK